MGKGIIVGTVYNRGGSVVSGADVWLRSLRGTAQGYEIQFTGDTAESKRKALAKTASNGVFILGFTWSNADIDEATGVNHTVSMELSASIDRGNQWSSTRHFSQWHTSRGFVLKDVLGMGGLSNSTFSSIPEMLDFGKTLIEAYRRMVMRPYYKEELLTSGGYLIIGVTRLWIEV